MEELFNKAITTLKEKNIGFDESQISDGYHTFAELYEFRTVYNALLFNEWALNKKYNVHKSVLHNDGIKPFSGEGEGDWFIVSAMLPTGLISNHYDMKDWDLFKVNVVKKALFTYDGHDSKDVLQRLIDLIIPF